jgi:predicted short-subunit dehydrogenase-like oxidoreductase (DUF2520 family)
MTEIRDTRIAFIGSGKVASELALIFQFKGLHISGISSRNTTSGKSLAHKLNCPFEENPLLLEADLIIVATNDASVLDLNALFDSKQLFAYTAGAVDLGKLSGVNWGVFYPLQTFTSNRHLGIDEIPVLIEAKDHKLQHLLSELCDYVGFRYAYCATADRQNYHLAAVFINNFVNHLIHQAQVQVKEAKLSWELLMPLLEETIAKLDDFTAHEAQTGPARRMDQTTIETHQNLLSPKDRDIYALMTKSIQKTYENE